MAAKLKPKKSAPGPRALTQKQEAFCLAYIECGNASEAYRRSYDAAGIKPESVNRMAKAVMDNVKIASRLAELRRPAVARALMTLDGHLGDLKILRNAAAKVAQFSAAISAEIARGKAAGIHIEKSEHLLNIAQRPDLSALAGDELAQLEALLGKAAPHA